jgi:hypothetical protein
MTPGAPEGCTSNDSWTDRVSKLFGSHSCENHSQDLFVSPNSDGQQAHQLSCNRNRFITDAEWIEQVEPGVYITVFLSPLGQKYLRHMRFRYCQLLDPPDSLKFMHTSLSSCPLIILI